MKEWMIDNQLGRRNLNEYNRTTLELKKKKLYGGRQGGNWVKRNKVSDSWFFGLGNWTRSNSEICLIATKGSPVRQSASVSQIIDTKIEGHSKKPDCVRDKIVELVGDIPRIELFARNKTEGWDVWGNEV